jgi:hypothetical protein
MDMLGKSLDLRPTLWGEFQREREQLIKLTKQQHLTLNMLNRQRQACISGCAGSGKTTLAIEKARRLANQQFRVLFTCYNKSLAADIRNKLTGGEYLQVYNYHDLCYELAERAGVLPAMPEQSNSQGFSRFFDQQLPEALLEAADVLACWPTNAMTPSSSMKLRISWIIGGCPCNIYCTILTGASFIFFTTTTNAFTTGKISSLSNSRPTP